MTTRRIAIHILILVAVIIVIMALAIWLNTGPVVHSAM
jgi:hypothetical protein